MSRPKPDVLLEFTNKNTYKTEQVLGSQGIWSVYLNDQSINLKSFNSLVSYPGPKYKKVSFSNPGHAINLAKKLNKLFKTKDFTVIFLSQGDVVYRDES